MLTIRKAEVDDIETINELAAIIFPATYGSIISAEQVEFMFEMMYAPHNIERQMQLSHTYYIAEVDGTPKGYLSLHQKGEGLYYINKIYTLPQAHGSGIGRALLEFAFAESLERNGGKPCRLELNVNRQNLRAINFYTKMGMHADRQTDDHVGGGFYANDYVMRIELGTK